MKKNAFKKTILVVGSFLVLPWVTMAISGIDSGDTRVKIYAEQGGDWFRALTLRTDSHGVLEIDNMLPGWYKAKVNEGDEESGQKVAVEAKMLDLDGREIDQKTTFDLYYKNDAGDSVAIGSVETDDDGQLEVPGLSADTEYKFDLDERDDSSVGQKDGKVRIRCKAKVDQTDWFTAYYNRTDENRVLEVENILPGRYKFKYKEQDGDITLPFTLDARFLNEDGERLKQSTKVHLWAYLGPEKTLTFAGEVWTNARGEVMIPGLMHDVKYKVEVFDN